MFSLEGRKTLQVTPEIFSTFSKVCCYSCVKMNTTFANINTYKNHTFAPNGTHFIYSTRHFVHQLHTIVLNLKHTHLSWRSVCRDSAYKDYSSLQKYVQKHKYTVVILLFFFKTNVCNVHAQHIVTVV